MNKEIEIDPVVATVLEGTADNADPAVDPIAEAIGAAEEIADPLDGLVEKIADDPGAAFTPEVLERLTALKKDDRAAFELLRSKLKKAGCRVTALDEAIAEENGDAGRGPTQADILVCESACKKDPVYGVIGVQKGPLSPGG